MSSKNTYWACQQKVETREYEIKGCLAKNEYTFRAYKVYGIIWIK